MFPIDPFSHGLKFSLGSLQFSPCAVKAIQGIEGEFIGLLYAYQCGRWCGEFKESNDSALHEGKMIMSIFELSSGVKLVVGTKADRSATGIVVADECEGIEF